MKKHAIFFAIVASAAVASGGVIFDNYPINGGNQAYPITSGSTLSDSFTLGSSNTLTGVNFGVWIFSGDVVTGVDWSLGSAAFGTDLGSGTGSVSLLTDFGVNTFGYDIQSLTFSLPNIVLGPGTFYLTLGNLVSTNSTGAFWDENDGPGVNAWWNSSGQLSFTGNCEGNNGTNVTCAESFQILGDPSGAVPEPGTFALGGGVLLVLGAVRRKFSA